MYGMQVKCIVTDSSGNAAESQIVTVTVEFPITITTQPQSVTANVGDQMNFSVKATGKSLSYQWYCRRSRNGRRREFRRIRSRDSDNEHSA